MKTLILGYGLLGKELVKQTGFKYISREKDGFDITSPVLDWYKTIQPENYGSTKIINCIAYTNTYDTDPSKSWNVNYLSVMKLVDFCNLNGIQLVHISTDYVYANSDPLKRSENDVPVHACNWYSYTKLLADAYIQARSENYLILRCTHKPKPFPFEKAWIDQIGNFDYVDVIAYLIKTAIENNMRGIVNIGTGLKTMNDLAKQSSTLVKACLKPDHVPANVSMDISLFKSSLL